MPVRRLQPASVQLAPGTNLFRLWGMLRAFLEVFSAFWGLLTAFRNLLNADCILAPSTGRFFCVLDSRRVYCTVAAGLG